MQRTWSVGDWIASASSRGERHSRYSQASTVAATNVPFSGMNEERRARYSNMSSLLDPTKRRNNQINAEMLSHVRTVFLEIVRVKYWNLIEGGKLPRHCRSAQFLLYSVDVGLDQAQHNPTSLLEQQELPEPHRNAGPRTPRHSRAKFCSRRSRCREASNVVAMIGGGGVSKGVRPCTCATPGHPLRHAAAALNQGVLESCGGAGSHRTACSSRTAPRPAG